MRPPVLHGTKEQGVRLPLIEFGAIDAVLFKDGTWRMELRHRQYRQAMVSLDAHCRTAFGGKRLKA